MSDKNIHTPVLTEVLNFNLNAWMIKDPLKV